MRAIREADRGRGARDFFHRDDVRQVAELGAAVLFLDRHAVQTESAELLPQVVREKVLAVDGRGAGRNFCGGKCLDRVAKRIDGVAQVEVEAGIVHGICLL